MLKYAMDPRIELLPKKPGVYIMRSKEGTVIYVGKAKNLKNRVRQYFQAGVKTDKVMAMVSNIADFYYIILFRNVNTFLPSKSHFSPLHKVGLGGNYGTY